LTAPLTVPFRLAAGRLALLRLELAVLRLALRLAAGFFLAPPDAFARPLVERDALELFLALEVVRFLCVLPPPDDVLLVAILSSPLENVRLVTTPTQAVPESFGVQAFFRCQGT
jgi:hypothetical protein